MIASGAVRLPDFSADSSKRNRGFNILYTKWEYPAALCEYRH